MRSRSTNIGKNRRRNRTHAQDPNNPHGSSGRNHFACAAQTSAIEFTVGPRRAFVFRLREHGCAIAVNERRGRGSNSQCACCKRRGDCHAAPDVADRARAGKLRPADIADATFTISNLGMYHVDQFMRSSPRRKRQFSRWGALSTGSSPSVASPCATYDGADSILRSPRRRWRPAPPFSE